MKLRIFNQALLALSILAASAPTQQLCAQSTAFIYQGRLNNSGAPANGSYDFTFSLFGTNSGGAMVTSPLTNNAVAVTNGLFSVTLDYGANFPGADRWLEIGVRTNGGGTFVSLTPRQPITPTPYAITASNLSGTVAASQLSGALPASLLAGTYGSALALSNSANQFVGALVALGPWVDVRAFGATTNGSDSTAAFLAALATQKNVYVPAGTYLLTNTLTLFDGQTFYGDGQLSVLNCAGLGNARVIMLGNNCMLKSLRVTGTTNAASNNDIRFAGNYSLVENVWIDNINNGFNAAGFHNLTLKNVYFNNVRALDAFATCIALANCNDVLIQGFWATNCDRAFTVGAGSRNILASGGALQSIKGIGANLYNGFTLDAHLNSGDTMGITNVVYENFHVEDSVGFDAISPYSTNMIDQFILRNITVRKPVYTNNSRAWLEFYNVNNAVVDGINCDYFWAELGGTPGCRNVTFSHIYDDSTSPDQNQIENFDGTAANIILRDSYFHCVRSSFLGFRVIGAGLHDLLMDHVMFDRYQNGGGLELSANLPANSVTVQNCWFMPGNPAGAYGIDDSCGARIINNTFAGDPAVSAIVLRSGTNAIVRQNIFSGVSLNNNGCVWVRPGVAGALIENNTGLNFYTDQGTGTVLRLNNGLAGFSQTLLATNGVNYFGPINARATNAFVMNTYAGRVRCSATPTYVTNSLVRTNSVVIGNINSDDAKASGLQIIPSKGLLKIKFLSAPAAPVDVSFLLVTP